MKHKEILISVLLVSMLVSTAAVYAQEAQSAGKKINTNIITNTEIAAIGQEAKQTPSYAATYGMIDQKVYSFDDFGWPCWEGVNSCWQSITNYTFNLPVNSYVFIDSSGTISSYEGYAGVAMAIDTPNPGYYDPQTYRIYSGGPLINEYNYWDSSTGFHTSRTYYLMKGTHTVYLDAMATRNLSNSYVPNIGAISITVRATGSGELQVKN